MSNTTKTVLIGVIVVVLLIVGFFVFTKPKVLAGAVSGMLAENYDPYIRNNGGYNSALPIQTSNSIIQSTSNGATTTLAVGCIQTTATSTASPIRLTFSPYAGTTTTQGGLSNFLVAAQFGSCPI